MNEQLKQAIESYYPEVDAFGYTRPNYSHFRKAAKDALLNPDFLRHADPEIMKAAGWVREDEWISVEDRLPNRDENVLLSRGKPFHIYLVTGFQRDGVFHSNESEKNFDKVTHWKPLPHPPKQ